MAYPDTNTVKSAENLRTRVDYLFKEPPGKIDKKHAHQLSLDLLLNTNRVNNIEVPNQSIKGFLDFVSDAMPDGDVYLFGGLLRDLALSGRKGFNSDIDLVVEGDWSHLVTHLQYLKAHKNKFGGYRLTLGGWPIDIWNAKDTWAIKKGLIPYKGISSLINTTVLNWDAILMNWRTREFIYRKNYFEEIDSRTLDIVLEENPNPLGMAVRVFRHLCLKDAKKLSSSAARYLAHCTKTYSFKNIINAELKSYGNTIVKRPVYDFFDHIDTSKDQCIYHESSIARDIVEKELEVT